MNYAQFDSQGQGQEGAGRKGKRRSASATATSAGPKKSAATVTVPGTKLTRAVYKGARGGKYILMDKEFVPLAKAMASAKAAAKKKAKAAEKPKKPSTKKSGKKSQRGGSHDKDIEFIDNNPMKFEKFSDGIKTYSKTDTNYFGVHFNREHYVASVKINNKYGIIKIKPEDITIVDPENNLIVASQIEFVPMDAPAANALAANAPAANAPAVNDPAANAPAANAPAEPPAEPQVGGMWGLFKSKSKSSKKTTKAKKPASAASKAKKAKKSKK